MGVTASTALWYASRATGIVALVLLTLVIVLGIYLLVSSGLFAAGVLALVGRAQYRAWRQSDPFSRGSGEEAQNNITDAEPRDLEDKKSDDRIVSPVRFGVKYSVDRP